MATDRRALTVGAILVVAMITLGLVIRDRLSPLDRWALGDAHVDAGSAFGQVATVVSGAAVLMCAAVLVVVAVVAWCRNPGRRKAVVRYPLVLLACAAVAATQQIFQRPGPPVVAADWTYPSGHASIATAVAFTAVALCMTMLPAWRTVVIAVESVGVVLTLVSRVALGEHYVTDVLGALAGVAGVGLLVLVAFRLTPGRPAPA